MCSPTSKPRAGTANLNRTIVQRTGKQRWKKSRKSQTRNAENTEAEASACVASESETGVLADIKTTSRNCESQSDNRTTDRETTLEKESKHKPETQNPRPRHALHRSRKPVCSPTSKPRAGTANLNRTIVHQPNRLLKSLRLPPPKPENRPRDATP